MVYLLRHLPQKNIYTVVKVVATEKQTNSEQLDRQNTIKEQLTQLILAERKSIECGAYEDRSY